MPVGLPKLPRLRAALFEEGAVPAEIRDLCDEPLSRAGDPTRRITALGEAPRVHIRRGGPATRLPTTPGIGAICAMALGALAPAAPTFRQRRDFAA